MAEDDARPGGRAHDESYRKLFSNPHIVRELLTEFVGVAVTGELQLDAMERLETTFIGDVLQRRQSDVLWKIPFAAPDAGALYVCLLLELQSRVDPTMPVRMMTYAGLLYEQLCKEDPSLARAGGLPPLLPVVLYNGAGRWTAPTALRQMIASPPNAGLASRQPTLDLILIDEGRLDHAALARSRSILARLFQIEVFSSKEALHAQIKLLATQVRALGVEQIARDVLLWLEEALKSKQLLLEDQQLHSFKQVETMFQESFDKWAAQQKALWFEEMREKIGEQVRDEVRVQVIEEVRVQVIEEVRAQEHIATQRATLLKLATLKFGAREGREAQLAALSGAQLDLALERLLSAQDEDELFAP